MIFPNQIVDAQRKIYHRSDDFFSALSHVKRWTVASCMLYISFIHPLYETLLHTCDLNNASQPRLFSTFEYRFLSKTLSILTLINFKCISIFFLCNCKPLGAWDAQQIIMLYAFFQTSFQNKELKYHPSKKAKKMPG